MILQIGAEAANKGIEKLFDTYVLFGVLGLLVLAMGAFCYVLYKRNDGLRDSHAAEIKEMNAEMRAASDRSILLLEKAANLMTTFPATTAENVSVKVASAVKTEIAALQRILESEIDIIKRMKCKYGKD